MLRMVLSDLDNTFLTPDKRITQANAQILDAAYEHGIQFVPCTGRNLSAVPAELLAHPAVSYAISANGAIIAEAKMGRILHAVEMDKTAALSLYEQVEARTVTFDVFADGKVYSNRKRFESLIERVPVDEATRAFVRSSRTLVDQGEKDLIAHAQRFVRLTLFCLTEADHAFVCDAVDTQSSMARTQSIDCNVEVMDRSANKGFGLRWLCSHVGIDPADTVAFGDNDNDRPMLEAAGDGVAVDNATAACKAAAYHMTASCSESGVARYLAPLLGV
ncbi:MAG: Cof-type HAD-IIB family hydrolase [Atopobiaceae bacterium]|jgi:Cof subfamily protein (haloacid dehalogenase superfamily)